jgi:hypothetical protein
MPVIVVTRLRLKAPTLLDEFFTAAVAAIEQAQKSDGNLGADALADANNVWWSVSACRTGRRAGATSPPTGRWRNSRTRQTQIKLALSRHRSRLLGLGAESGALAMRKGRLRKPEDPVAAVQTRLPRPPGLLPEPHGCLVHPKLPIGARRPPEP